MNNLYIFAGVNGAGKSTFYIKQLENLDFYGARINSDEIVREFGDWRNQDDQTRAGKLALKLRKHYLERGVDFNIETTLSGKGIVKFIEEAKEKGYHITLYYVGLNSVELSKQRVAIRASKNGHSIDEAILERRYKQSFENLAKIMPLCDKFYIYDNSEFIKDEQEQKFSNLKLVAEKSTKDGLIERYANAKWFEDVFFKSCDTKKATNSQDIKESKINTNRIQKR